MAILVTLWLLSAFATRANTDADNRINGIIAGHPVWTAGDASIPFERFDIPKLTLTTLDGTRFHLEHDLAGANAPYYYLPSDTGARVCVQPRPGQLRLASIEQRTGDKLVITPTEIHHERANAPGQITRKVTFVRDDHHVTRHVPPESLSEHRWRRRGSQAPRRPQRPRQHPVGFVVTNKLLAGGVPS